MKNSKKIGFIILSEDKNNLQKTIESIYNIDYNKKYIELVIINRNKDRKIKEYCNSLKNQVFVTYIEENDDVPNIYNKIKSTIKADYITFINDKMRYCKINNLKKYINNFEEELIAIKLTYYDKDANKLIDYKIQPEKQRKIDLKNEPFSLSMHLERFLIPISLAQKIDFDCGLELEYMTKYLIELYEIKQNYLFLDKCILVTYEPLEDNTSKNSVQYKKDWYSKSVKDLLLPIASKYNEYNMPLYIEEIILYLIYAKFNCNTEDRNKGILTKEEFKIFNDLVSNVLLKIDDDIIMQNKKGYYNDISINKCHHLFKIPKWLRIIFINNKINKLKATKEIKVIETSYKNSSNYLLYKKENKTNIVKISSDKSDSVIVEAINYKNGRLTFDCTTSLEYYLNENEINIYVKYNNKKIEIKRKNCYSLLKAFGVTLTKKFFFQFEIDIRNLEKEKIEVHALIDNKDKILNFKFSRVQARLCDSKRSFWQYKDFILFNKKNYLLVTKYKTIKLIISEIIFDLSKLKNEKNKIRVCKLIFLRMLYYLTKPYYKNKHIWLTWDKLYKAGDNGEYIYQYCLKQKRNIYYIIKKEAPDYKRLIKQNKKHIIVYNSLKSKLLSLHSELILKTHANVISYCGFEGLSRKLICGLFNPEIIEIQHGLTIQKIAQYQNRLFDNIKHYCCASKYEVENILGEMYDFDKSQITLTGLARYDGLKTKDKKIILITPTWRRNVVNSSVAHIRKKHNDNFKSSEYFRLYNNLINNKKLIEKAKETGYKIIYLLHPAMSGQIDDFDKNNYVKIIPATGDMNYEKILTESSLMVTDYSGVQFDFAYQRKAIIYYHPDTLPPHYEAGGLDYETMGFGPICKTESSIINELCKYMENDCQIKPLYQKRADDFFEFNDFNNCQRIIETIEKYLEEEKK